MEIPQVIVGPLGQKLLFYQSQVYTQKGSTRTDKMRWKCRRMKRFKCKGGLQTDNFTYTTVFSSTPHNHPPLEDELEEMERQFEVKKLAYKLLDDNVKPKDLIDKLPNYKSICSKKGEISKDSLKRSFLREKTKLKKQALESESVASTVIGALDGSSWCDFLGVSQNETGPLLSAPSTSGVVPTPSTDVIPPPDLSQSSNQLQIPPQTNIRASEEIPILPIEPQTNVGYTPLPIVRQQSSPIAEPGPQVSSEDSSISVKWNLYATNMSSIMPCLLESEKFVDVTLACDGQYIKCHKVMLGACSPYFEQLLSVNPCQHPIILMRDFNFWEIQAIVDFIYRGAVEIPQEKLPKLLEVARVLQIKGLTGSINHSASESTAENAKPVDCVEENQVQSSKKRKISQVKLGESSKASEVPLKKPKTFNSSRTTSTSNITPSDETSDYSSLPQLPNQDLAKPQEPWTMLHSVCVKEETSYEINDAQHLYKSDILAENENSQLGQFQQLTIPDSRPIKHEPADEAFEPPDPLDFQSKVS